MAKAILDAISTYPLYFDEAYKYTNFYEECRWQSKHSQKPVQ